MVELSAKAVLSRREGIESSALEDGAVLVNMNSGACFELNRIGAEVWSLLASGTTEAAICATLAGRYEVERVVLEGDIRRLLEALVAAGLVEQATTETGR